MRASKYPPWKYLPPEASWYCVQSSAFFETLAVIVRTPSRTEKVLADGIGSHQRPAFHLWPAVPYPISNGPLNSSSKPRFRKPALNAWAGGSMAELTVPSEVADCKNQPIRT